MIADTGCECPLAGYCKRHNVRKNAAWHKLCTTNDNYFKTWEQGKGPGQFAGVKHDDKPPSWVGLVSYFKAPEDAGVGDTVQRYAAMLGGELFKQWSKRLGLPCGCTQRQAEWNVRWPYKDATEPSK